MDMDVTNIGKYVPNSSYLNKNAPDKIDVVRSIYRTTSPKKFFHE